MFSLLFFFESLRLPFSLFFIVSDGAQIRNLTAATNDFHILGIIGCRLIGLVQESSTFERDLGKKKLLDRLLARNFLHYGISADFVT